MAVAAPLEVNASLEPWPEMLQTTGRIEVGSAIPRKRRMMFRSEALRTRYIIRSDEPWLEMLEALRPELTSGVALPITVRIVLG